MDLLPETVKQENRLCFRCLILKRGVSSGVKLLYEVVCRLLAKEISFLFYFAIANLFL